MPMATNRARRDPSEPADFGPEQRQREVAAILAAGVIRMREKRRGRLGPECAPSLKWLE